MSNKTSLVAVAGLSAVCLGLLWNQQKSGIPETVSLNHQTLGIAKPVIEKTGRGSISVSGDDQRMFVADEYVTSFVITEKNKVKNKAFVQVGEDRDKVLALFKKLKIDEKSVEQASVNVNKEWTYVKNKRVDDGFLAVQSFEVRLPSKDASEALEQELTQFAFVDGVRSKGQLKNAESMEMETIKSACKKAKLKADEYAQSVGAKVGTAITVKGYSFADEYYSQSDSVRVNAIVQTDMRLVGKNDSKNSYVTVNQHEQKMFLADKFIVSASVSIDGKSKEALYKQVAEKRSQIVELAKNLGVAESEIDVKSIYIRKKGKWELREAEQAKNPVMATQAVTVNFTSKAAAVAFYSALAEIENVMMNEATPALTNEDSLRVQVTHMAAQKALARAKALAEGFGGKMGDVVNVADNAESGLDEMVLNEFDSYNDAAVLRKSPPRGKMALSGLLGGGSAAMNIADSVEISSFISVVTELEY